VVTLKKLSPSIAKLSEKPASKKKAVNHDSVEIVPDDVDQNKKETEVPITFESGMKKFRAKDFDEAKDIFLKLSENKKAGKKSREGAILHLGLIEFKKKNYEAAKVHFSKVFTDNPDSSFAPASLLQLGKTFKALKSNEEASMAFDELLNRFPKSKEAQEVSKLK
jgi:TolA-binding protein